MNSDLRSLVLQLRTASDDADAAQAVDEIAAHGDPAAIPILTRQLHRTGIVAEALVEALSELGHAAAPALRRVAEHANDWDARRHALLLLARLGDAGAMKTLARDFRRAQTGPLATARWLIACGRAGILALADSPKVDLFEVQELAVHAAHAEVLLLGLVERPDGPLPLLALAALARIPSRRAARVFERILAHRSRSAQARRIALRGLELLRVRGAAVLMRRIACDERETRLLRGACIDALTTIARAA